MAAAQPSVRDQSEGLPSCGDVEAVSRGNKATSSETEQAQAPKRDLSHPQGLAQAQWL